MARFGGGHKILSHGSLSDQAQFDMLPPRGFQMLLPSVAGIDWPAVMADPTRPVVFVNRLAEAERLCRAGQPAIAVVGVGKGKFAKWLRKQGAKVHLRANMN